MKYLILLFVLLTSSSALAQEAPVPSSDPESTYEKPAPVETIPLGKDKITSVRKGALVPYDGQLFDIDTAIRWGFWLQQYKYRLEADTKKYQQLCRVEMNFRDKKLTIERERNKTVEKDLRNRLLRSEKARLAAEEEARNPPWYSTPTFGVVLGAVATAAVFGIAVAAIDATRP